MSERDAAVRVRLEGMVRGAEHDAAADAWVEADAVALDRPDGAPLLRIPLLSLEGMRVAHAVATLYLAHGDALELHADDDDAAWAAFAATLRTRAFAVPEVTRALRAYGSRHGRPGSDHDRFFAPLVDPLRAVRDEVARGGAEPWRASDRAAGDAMADAMRRTVAALAQDRFPDAPPERRALEAELLDIVEPVLAALARLGEQATALRRADDDVRLVRWHAWARALADAFARADRAWIVALPALADSRGGGGRLWRRVLRRGPGGLAVVALLAGGARTLVAQGGADAHAIVRVSGADSLDVRALARRGFDVVPGRPGERLVVVDARARARLERLGASLATVQTPRAPLARRVPGSAPDALAQPPRIFRSYDEPGRGVRALLDSLARASNGRVRLDTLGRTLEGRPILAAKVGPAGDDASRANVIFLATYHAREWAGTEMALRLLRHLAAPPTPSPRLDSLIARRDVWIVPVANPDGYEYTFTTDRLWRKNRRPFGERDGKPVVGVDLNRNHSVRWGIDDDGSSPEPVSEIYRGPSAASELEIQAIERFHALHPPVVSVSYHTFAGVLLYPIGWRSGLLSPDESLYRALAGTDERPAVRDRLPGAPYGYQRPEPAWQLYPTNGEYTDFASERFGTLAFTPEISSGFEGAQYYGFEFPEDESRLQTLFEDNLPFALDAIEAAGDPLRWRSPTTGLAAPRVALESTSPTIRVRSTAAATISVDGAPRRTTSDAVDIGRWQRRTRTDSTGTRPDAVDVVATDTVRFRVLLTGGAEPGDTAWTLSGFTADGPPLVGRASWRVNGDGTLRSPVVRVPDDVDTLTVALWSRHFGDPFGPSRLGEVRLSRDGGRTFVERVLTVAGDARVFYPESRVVAGVRGQTVQFELRALSLPWNVDEFAVVGHLPTRAATAGATVAFRASDNPVRGDRVRFTWPFVGLAGDLFVYDLTGRMVWRSAAEPSATELAWDVGAESGLANGAYLVLARAGAETRRQTLYVLRPGR